MADSLTTFRIRMAHLGRLVEENLGTLVEHVAFRVQSQVVVDTPGDTGRARSNWLVSNGGPTYRTIPPYFPGRHIGTKETSNAKSAIDAARAVINAHRAGQDIWICNNLDYIRLLNDGDHSNQAPRQFVQKAVAQGLRVVRQERLLAKRLPRSTS